MILLFVVAQGYTLVWLGTAAALLRVGAVPFGVVSLGVGPALWEHGRLRISALPLGAYVAQPDPESAPEPRFLAFGVLGHALLALLLAPLGHAGPPALARWAWATATLSGDGLAALGRLAAAMPGDAAAVACGLAAFNVLFNGGQAAALRLGERAAVAWALGTGLGLLWLLVAGGLRALGT